jgi:hypothetical protein
MNSNNNPNQNGGSTNSTNREASKLITLTAFVIGYLLIDNLNSNEQNALGSFFMLVGQTLCTSGSENFKRDWSPILNPTNDPSNNGENNNYSAGKQDSMTREQAVDMLHRARDVFNQEIDKIK